MNAVTFSFFISMLNQFVQQQRVRENYLFHKPYFLYIRQTSGYVYIYTIWVNSIILL